MRVYVLLLLMAVVVFVECGHTFMGTNIFRPLVYHHNAKYSKNIFTKRIESINYTLPHQYVAQGRTIQGILAYDMTYSSASANITKGGLGNTFLKLRMKSERGKDLHYDVYIYS